MRALVTGGGGFLGSAIVRLLRARGVTVRSLARGHYPELAILAVEQVRGDIGEAASVAEAVQGCDVVFHVAARAGIGVRLAPFQRTNVAGTQHVLAACRAQGVPRLIYTSSPSVVFHGGDMENADESAPYPAHYDAPYPQTKAAAEKLVLAANDAQLATVALRPHLIWGPGDNHLVPRILARARAGKLRRIGGRNPRIDSVYIDNAAEAHLLALDRLAPGAACAGKAYFISNGEPWPLWDLVNGILAAAEQPPVSRSVPRWLALALGWLCERFYQLRLAEAEPPMTRFLARELSSAHWFNLGAARRDLGYEPKISITEGLERLTAWLREQRPDSRRS